MSAELSFARVHPAQAGVVIVPRDMFTALAAIIAVLALLHLAAMPVYVYGMKGADGIHVRAARYFMLQNERSVPTWFSVVLIAMNMGLLVLNGVANRQLQGATSTLSWLSLAAVFAFLSLDEQVTIHEAIGDRIGTAYDVGGFLSFPWIVAGAAFTLIVGLSYIGFLRRLPRRTAGLFLLSGGIFVGGALVVEMIEGRTIATFGFGAAYYLLVLIEETMEMLGQALFAFALLDHLALTGGPIRLAPPLG
ncbi:hypothetical protein [Albidovulum sp.]|uniref:hypothetical protein n=1 Tax=Albidovulum sp. TaxID=1872424 RepID=UPI0039B8522F